MPRPQEIDVGFSLPAPLLWQIEAPILDIPFSQLIHNLDIPYREKEETDDWNLTPRDCLTNSEKEVSHFQLIEKADLQFPIIVYQHQGQWIILDGVHRFAKAWKEGRTSILAKLLTFDNISPFLSKDNAPFFLFQKAPFPFSEKEMKADFSSSFLVSLEKYPYFSARCYKNFFLKHAYRLNETNLQTANQLHKRESDFFSASYSGEWLLLGISKEKIGLDLEIIKPRDESLLQAYKIELETHFGIADWNTFYLLRTAKEAILKASDTENLDRLTEITILSAKKQTQMTGTLTFNRELNFSFQKKIWRVWSFEDGEKAYSITLLAKKEPKDWLLKFFFIMSGICFFAPFFFYGLLHTDYSRYLRIIKQDFPFSHFGSGPFQFWFLIVLPFLLALCLGIIAYFLGKKSNPKADELVLKL